MSNSANRAGSHSTLEWAHLLGLAASPLFGALTPPPEGVHYAMLDGRGSSFACSEVDFPNIEEDLSRGWRWSADLAHHVIITPDQVGVRSGREDLYRRFNRTSVERHLNDFLAFLDRSPSSYLPDVVSFLLEEFRQTWALMPANRAQGHAALAVFLTGLQAASEPDSEVFQDPGWRCQQARELGLGPDLTDLLEHLSLDLVSRTSQIASRTPLRLRLVPSLVLRHAAGRLFQEAHAYLEGAQLGLFGDAAVSTVPTFSPSGAYFTPVPLARLLADAALQHWSVFPSELSIADYACGSAVFLTEALRALERRQFKGKVHVIGRDVSAEAIIMARVAVATTSRDLLGIEVVADLQQADSLRDTPWPNADVVLMNPPFRSWEQMKTNEREWVKNAMREQRQGRPDLCVGFVEHALTALRSSGVLATLLPAGVLASESLQKWRQALLSRATPKVVAILGEHGLFRHALVNVGIMVLQQRSQPQIISIDNQTLHVAWASVEAGAASQMMRALRRHLTGASEEVAREHTYTQWTATRTSLKTWAERPSWLPGPGTLGSLLDAIRNSVSTRVEDLFHVRQGIRTGAKDVFLVSREKFANLSRTEQRCFVPAVDNLSIIDGVIKPRVYLFIPDPNWNSPADVQHACPTFFQEVLIPARDQLRRRKGIDRERWWQLTRARGWAFDKRSRLVSKRFGLYPAFALELKGVLAIVQGNAWVPTEALARGREDTVIRELLTAYWWLLNSRVAVALFREYCPNVAGGQLDLEHKYVKHVPLPNLEHRLSEDPALQKLAISLRANNTGGLPPITERDSFAAAAYGTSLVDWPLTGL
ncbi:MAG: N-6 DNA methylase [Deltaproteobacteria bacterium]|nr:N-6 DNA methylase [Deltaproteobacteria bacterium]